MLPNLHANTMHYVHTWLFNSAQLGFMAASRLPVHFQAQFEVLLEAFSGLGPGYLRGCIRPYNLTLRPAEMALWIMLLLTGGGEELGCLLSGGTPIVEPLK